MHVVITYLLTAFIILVVVLTIGREMIATFGEVTDAWTTAQARHEDIAGTRLSAPVGLTVNPGTTVDITLVNEGKTALAQFADWDVIFEIQEGSGVTLAYLDYTTDANPAAGQWTVRGIYLDADALTAEILYPDVLNPGEEMIVRAELSSTMLGSTYHRATFVTPNGVTTGVMFEAPATLYVLDESDRLVYEYLANSTLIGTHALDPGNAAAKGITTDDTDFWTTDAASLPDTAYKYDSAFALDTTWSQALLNDNSTGITTDGANIWVSDTNALRVFKYDMNGNPDVGLPSFGLNLSNTDPTGIATDGANIWIADDGGNAVYRYDMDGNFETSFALAVAEGNTLPTGITTNGVSIWVVDAGGAVYRYTMSGGYVSSFDLDAANADPEGITVSPR
ncbi:MAG: hypothetical protein L0177_07330 [Chloroflexi bacterium]|nr:hypothetical protein [Chloroflexota bacterium]